MIQQGFCSKTLVTLIALWAVACTATPLPKDSPEPSEPTQELTHDTSPPVADIETEKNAQHTLPHPTPHKSRQVNVLLMAGQSNMNGHGVQRKLPKPMRREFLQPGQHAKAVKLHWRNARKRTATKLIPLQPASSLKGCFGPELSLGRDLIREQPDTRFVLAKHAVAWTSLARDWNPDPAKPGPQYSTFLDHSRRTLELVRSNGDTPKLIGVLWMQGEKDGASKHALEYQANLTRFIAQVRHDFETPTLPFFIGKIAAPNLRRIPKRQIVRDAQMHVAQTVPGVVLIDTDTIPLMTDGLHYNALGQIELGSRFAAAVLEYDATQVPPSP